MSGFDVAVVRRSVWYDHPWSKEACYEIDELQAEIERLREALEAQKRENAWLKTEQKLADRLSRENLRLRMEGSR